MALETEGFLLGSNVWVQRPMCQAEQGLWVSASWQLTNFSDTWLVPRGSLSHRSQVCPHPSGGMRGLQAREASLDPLWVPHGVLMQSPEAGPLASYVLAVDWEPRDSRERTAHAAS